MVTDYKKLLEELERQRASKTSDESLVSDEYDEAAVDEEYSEEAPAEPTLGDPDKAGYGEDFDPGLIEDDTAQAQAQIAANQPIDEPVTITSESQDPRDQEMEQYKSEIKDAKLESISMEAKKKRLEAFRKAKALQKLHEDENDNNDEMEKEFTPQDIKDNAELDRLSRQEVGQEENVELDRLSRSEAANDIVSNSNTNTSEEEARKKVLNDAADSVAAPATEYTPRPDANTYKLPSDIQPELNKLGDVPVNPAAVGKKEALSNIAAGPTPSLPVSEESTEGMDEVTKDLIANPDKLKEILKPEPGDEKYETSSSLDKLIAQYEKGQVDSKDELAEANRKASMQKFIANIGKIGSQYTETMTGAKAPAGFYKGMDDAADADVAAARAKGPQALKDMLTKLKLRKTMKDIEKEEKPEKDRLLQQGGKIIAVDPRSGEAREIYVDQDALKKNDRDYKLKMAQINAKVASGKMKADVAAKAKTKASDRKEYDDLYKRTESLMRGGYTKDIKKDAIVMNKIETILDKYEGNNIPFTKQDAYDISTALSKLQIGGVPGIQLVEKTIYKNMKGEAADIAQKLSGDPKQYYNRAVLKKIRQQNETYKEATRDIYEEMIRSPEEKLVPVFERNPEFKKTWEKVFDKDKNFFRKFLSTKKSKMSDPVVTVMSPDGKQSMKMKKSVFESKYKSKGATLAE